LTDATIVKKRIQKKQRPVSASELAQMGVCERLVVFEHRVGMHRTDEQRLAIKRGLKTHDQFYREGVLASDALNASEKKGRCYIATHIFGSGPETEMLRQFRDRVLRSYAVGRWLIGVYYRTAPGMCLVLTRYAWLRIPTRALLTLSVWLTCRLLRGKENRHVTK
jgi:hypothetical protein